MFPLKTCPNSRRQRRGARGFTVVELMVAVSLMTLIVAALYSMFNQTQKAMRLNEAQVDSAERGRGVLELLSRELESARVGLRQEATNLWLRTPMLGSTQSDGIISAQINVPPLRTNVFDDVYYLTKAERAWRGVGYLVLQNTNVGSEARLGRPMPGVGTLYRYETPLTNRDYAFPSTNLWASFVKELPVGASGTISLTNATNFAQISQGIVHFRVLPYDTKGQLMAFATTNLDSTYRLLRTGTQIGVQPYPLSNVQGPLAGSANAVLALGSTGDPLVTLTTFRSNALPAYLELELGVLEPDALRTYNQMIKDDQPAQAASFLQRRIAKVQIFRKR
ncbi:MAG TPA: prepilin-type N-terminal cleavage/methylation domain-containing protein, partial [Verrucomicrobiae bacterium]|nr:prepilin-type N-terminal cleavage/methylation domain-containing protein [Verrucomicrobiae bacterium]